MKKKYVILIVIGLVLVIGGYFGYKSYYYFKYIPDALKIRKDYLGILKTNETITVKTETLNSNDYFKVNDINIRNDFKDFELSDKFANDENSSGFILKENGIDKEPKTIISLGKSIINYFEALVESSDDNTTNKWIKDFVEKENIRNDLDLMRHIINNQDKKPNIFSSKHEIEFYAYEYITLNLYPVPEKITFIDGDLSGFIIECRDLPVREIYLFSGENKYVISLWNKEYFTYDYIKELLNTIIIDDKFNQTNNSEDDKIKEKLSYLKETKTILINSYKDDNKKITINEENISKIVEIISKGKELEENEFVPYIGAGYEIKLLGDEDNIIETIKFYLPSGYRCWVSLEKSNTSYYVDTDAILDILGLEKD